MSAGGKLSPSAHWKRCMTWTKRRSPITCSNCESIFIPIAGIDKRDAARVKTCSNDCARQLKSNRLKERHKNKEWSSNVGSLGGRASAKKQCRRSKDEKQLFALCAEYFTTVTHNEQIVDGWDADIIVHDLKIAILWNGPWHYQEMPGLVHSLKQVQNRDKIKIKEFTKLGWNVLVFEDRHYTPSEAFNEIIAGMKK